MPSAFSRLAQPPVFITGYSRSGTSWVLDLFAQHPEVCAVFETWLLTRGSGVTGVLHQPQWVPEFSRQHTDKIGLPSGAVQLLPYEEAARDLGELVAGWLVRAMNRDQRYLVEKGPLDMTAAAAMFPHARFVHVLRDGRDVALSMRAAARSWAPEMDPQRSLASQAASWCKGVEGIRTEAEALDGRYVEVRFEDLVADVVAASGLLFDFAGVPHDEKLLARIHQATALSTYDRKTRESGFRRHGRAGAWREQLSRREGRKCDDAAGELLVQLGYETDRSWWRTLPRFPSRVRR